ncbi:MULTISPECIES: hypothetical protein [unclassified Aeromicrobium]|uniref:hypothetical protein n=1 Tax=unclassified Aeromicrobium TaxID=2633570 RepID=UPI0028897A7B|nr:MULTISPECIES: hypothetical protein [unclassified Aeromicrobium]
MANGVTITGSVDDEDKKRGMTLGEVAHWVERAQEAGIAPDTPVGVVTGWRGQIHKLEASS